jgi:hypothetical protein
MRFHNGPIPDSQTFDPIAAGWTPLRTPNDRRFVAVAMLYTVPFLLAATTIFLHSAPAFCAVFRLEPWSLPSFLLLLLALVPAHEFIHALAYGCGLRSPNLVVGVWLQRGIPYVLCDEPLPRRRVLFMLAAPFCALTLLPLPLVPLLSEPLFSCVLFFILLHAALCVGDAATFLRLLRQAPPEARVHNQGWQTYWGTSTNANGS